MTPTMPHHSEEENLGLHIADQHKCSACQAIAHQVGCPGKLKLPPPALSAKPAPSKTDACKWLQGLVWSLTKAWFVVVVV